MEVVADGDSKTFAELTEWKPYGEGNPVVKHECVGHIQKRMTNRIEALKKTKTKDENGELINIGGKGRVTKEVVARFQKYFGKAIRGHKGDPEGMKDAIMAIYYHSLETPQHHLCPRGTLSWCKHQRALAKGEKPPQPHTTILNKAASLFLNVFRKLSYPALIERCLLGASQNPNESFNSLIWNRCPKTEFCSRTVVSIAVDLAVMTFNSGKVSLRSLFDRLGLSYGSLTSNFFQSQDDNRVWLAEWKSSDLVKKRRQAMMLDRVALEERLVEEEGVPYEAGGWKGWSYTICSVTYSEE